MSTSDKIQNLVQEIWSPNVEDTLPEDIDSNHENRYHFILAFLTTHIKKCVSKQYYTPYIQLKDKSGKFVFNDRLQININTKKDPFNDPKTEYHLDFINDGTSSHTLYCMTTTMINGIEQTGFISVDFKTHVDYLNHSDYHNVIQPILERIGASLQNNQELYLSITAHQYHVKTKVWNIEFPMGSR
jgi:hypothetical protein